MSEVIQNRNLHELLERNRPLPDESIIVAALHLAFNLDSFHKQNKIFGIICPDQVVFGENNNVQLFELAAPRTPEDLTLSYLCFVAPELLEGKPPTFQSDIYSFGIILYAFAVGRVPFSTRKREELVDLILQGKLDAFPRFPAGMNELDWIIRKCLIHVPRRRFGSAEEIGNELRHLVKSGRKFQPVMPATPAAGEAAPAFKIDLKKYWSLAQQYWKIPAAASLLIILTIAAFWFFSRSGAAPLHNKKWKVEALTNTMEQETDASFSPNGDEIVYTSNLTANWELYIRRLRGTKHTELTNSPGREENPKWSPDGELILYTYRGTELQPTLFAVSSNGGIPQKLVENATEGQWSADGKWICYVSPAFGKIRSLYLFDLKNMEPRLVLKDQKGLAHPSFSQDGKQIVCEADSEKGHGLFVVNVRSGKIKPLTKGPMDLYPSWSWKNDNIFFSCLRNQTYGICRTDREGEVPEQIAGEVSANDYWPAPSPNTDEVIFTRELLLSDTYSLDLDSGVSRVESLAPGASCAPRSISSGKSILYVRKKQNRYSLCWLSKHGLGESVLVQDLAEPPLFSVSQDGSSVFIEEPSAGKNGLIQILLNESKSFNLGQSLVLPYEISPDRKQLLLSTRQGDQVSYSLQNLKTQAQEQLFSLPFSNRIVRAAWIDRGKALLLLLKNGMLFVRSITAKQNTAVFKNCYDFAMKPNTDTLVALVGPSLQTATMITFEYRTQKQKSWITFEPDSYAQNVDWSKDGKFVFYDRFKKGADLYLAN
jgi:Tol biopolymer transport system component